MRFFELFPLLSWKTTEYTVDTALFKMMKVENY